MTRNPQPQDPLLPITRNLYCPSYDQCLSSAAALNWSGFSCSSCPSSNELPPPHSLDLPTESLRCLKLLRAAFPRATSPSKGFKLHEALGEDERAEGPDEFRTVSDNIPIRWKRMLGIL